MQLERTMIDHDHRQYIKQSINTKDNEIRNKVVIEQNLIIYIGIRNDRL